MGELSYYSSNQTSPDLCLMLITDFATMESKLEGNSYATLDQFIYDARLIFGNCRSYNDNQSNCTLSSRLSSSLRSIR